jgi:chromosome segregation ATPase
MSGLMHGQAGHGYSNVCPAETAPGFLRGYTLGNRQHSLQSRLNSLQGDYGTKEAYIDDLSHKLKDAPDADRRDIRRRMDDLEDDLRRNRREQRDVQDELDNTNAEVQWFQQNPNAAPPVPGY